MWLDEGGVADTIAGASGQTARLVRAATAGAAATGRFTTPEQVADLVVFLASDRSGNITGSDLRIDGGLITTI
jgi:NAD(P)-dependent dehydrogenase (short-subunit alcohol dehydrogenase family)